MKYTTIENNKAVHVLRVDPISVVNESYAATFIECPDEVEAGWVLTDGVWSAPPGPTLAEIKTAKNTQINLWRATANQTYFTHGGKQIACDQLSRSDIDAVANSIALTGAFPAGFPGAWKAVDNTYIMLPDVAAFKGMHASMTAQGTINFGHSQTLKATVAAATTAEQVNEVVW